MKKTLLFLSIIVGPLLLNAQPDNRYWNSNTQLIPWRFPFTSEISAIEKIDLDNDKDTDVLKGKWLNGLTYIWIDDDDDMKTGHLEGDTDNDCLCVDMDGDGLYGGPRDLCIDWTDTDNDGIAEIQLVVQNGSLQTRNYFDWSADFMYIIDWGENDGIHNFINWNNLILRAWEHNGHANFFTDYHGNTLFMKMHGSTFRINDLRYNWENPFIFFDDDKDDLSEMAIRLVDTPHFRPKPGDPTNPELENLNKEYDIKFTQRIDYAAITWDLDNDNGQGNEFDFDMSLKFAGKGFDYSNQKHHFKNMLGLPEADKYFYDARWRQVDELIYPDEKVAYEKVFKEGVWDYCWLVFDEDDDCNRWERVEFYEPRNLWKIGGEKGGLDNNKQADATGDRGEFDMDNSGKGNLYIAPFDGRLHLHGAEWGVWRIDMNARYFQGYGGLYPPAEKHERDQKEPAKWATIRYSDTDSNGYFDKIEYDLNGDTIFDETVSLKTLGINDRVSVINTADTDYKSFNRIFVKLADNMWNESKDVVRIAEKMGVNTNWYAFWQQPRNLNEKYQYGFWLKFYLYHDMRDLAKIKENKSLLLQIDKAYYSGNWESLNIE
ncbi:MAG: hypothetical protein JNK09_15675 [Prolixibacteraceae bacterium]|nr:hypothetical protein [Prolixibacteraceae bacterium]